MGRWAGSRAHPPSEVKVYEPLLDTRLYEGEQPGAAFGRRRAAQEDKVPHGLAAGHVGLWIATAPHDHQIEAAVGGRDKWHRVAHHACGGVHDEDVEAGVCERRRRHVPLRQRALYVSAQPRAPPRVERLGAV